MSVAPPAETPVPASPQAPVAPAGRAFAWTAAPVLAALLVREASQVSLAGAGVPATALAVSGLYIGSAVLAATPGVALVSVLARRRDLGPATVLGLLLAGSGGAAMAGFWAWFASPGFGRGFDVALGVASVAAIAVFGRRGDLRAAGLPVPMLLALAIGLAFTGLAFIQGDGIAQNVVSAIASRYWRTQDNAIPLLFATRVAAHAPCPVTWSVAGCLATGHRSRPASRSCNGPSGAATAGQPRIKCSRPGSAPRGCPRCGSCSGCAAWHSGGSSWSSWRRP